MTIAKNLLGEITIVITKKEWETEEIVIANPNWHASYKRFLAALYDANQLIAMAESEGCKFRMPDEIDIDRIGG